MITYDMAYGITGRINEILGSSDRTDVDNVIGINKDSVQGTMLENIRRVAEAIAMGRGQDNGRIGFGLDYDKGRDIIMSGFGFTTNGGVIYVEDKVKAPTVANGQSLYLNSSLKYGDYKLQSTVNKDDEKVIIDVNPIASLTPESGDAILIGSMSQDGVWERSLYGFLGIKGDELDAKNITSDEIIGNNVTFNLSDIDNVDVAFSTNVGGSVNSNEFLSDVTTSTTFVSDKIVATGGSSDVIVGGTQTYTDITGTSVTTGAHPMAPDTSGGFGTVTGGTVIGGCFNGGNGVYTSVIGGRVVGAKDSGGNVIPDFNGGITTGGVINGLHIDGCNVTYTSITGANTVDGYFDTIVGDISGGVVTGGVLSGGRIQGGTTTTVPPITTTGGTASYRYVVGGIIENGVDSGGVTHAKLHGGITSNGDINGLEIVDGIQLGACSSLGSTSVSGNVVSPDVVSPLITVDNEITSVNVTATSIFGSDLTSGTINSLTSATTLELKAGSITSNPTSDIANGNLTSGSISAINSTGVITANGFIGNFAGVHSPGDVILYAGKYSIPGWLMCDGSYKNARSNNNELMDLYNVIQNRYGGTGEEDFMLPDLIGRFPISTGTYTKVRTDCSSGGAVTISTNNETEGEDSVCLKLHEIPDHGHKYHLYNISESGEYDTGSNKVWRHRADSQIDTETGPAGGDGYHGNIPPYLCINYLIKI